tara:strand:+ start:463 stop:633 length:171 start_codon:yes stop_codon:yes gene_type:complete
MKTIGYKLLVSKELLTLLEGIYPDKLPTKVVDKEDLAFLLGQQSVVQRLREIHEDE